MSQPITPAERARKNESTVLNALSAAGQNAVALAMGTSESTVTRMKEKDIAQVSALMAHCGLKVVPVGMACFDPQYVEALKTLAEVGIKQQAPKLDWNESA